MSNQPPSDIRIWLEEAAVAGILTGLIWATPYYGVKQTSPDLGLIFHAALPLYVLLLIFAFLIDTTFIRPDISGPDGQ